MGIDLSVGQIDALLSDHNEPFFAEKDGLLQVGFGGQLLHHGR